MKDLCVIPVFVNGVRVSLRGYKDTLRGGELSFRDPVTFDRVVEVSGLTIPGARVVVTYTSSAGTRSLVQGQQIETQDLEPNATFTAKYD